MRRRLLVALVAALFLFLLAGLWRNAGQPPALPVPPAAYPPPSLPAYPTPVPAGPYPPPPVVTLDPYPLATQTAVPATTPAPPTATPPQTPITPTATPTPAPPRPGATPTRAAAAGLSDPLFIDNLREKQPHSGDIDLTAVWAERPQFTRHHMRYGSEGQTVTGYINLPRGNGPFPVLVLNHGYFLQERYTPGLGTVREADYLAERGYVVAVSNFRSYAGSDAGKDGGGHFGVDWLYDSLNLIDAVKRLPQVDPTRVGVWGHSTGGLYALQTAVSRRDIRAFVVVSTMSADMTQTLGFLRAWRPWVADDVVRKFGTPQARPEHWARMSPINYLAGVTAPIQVHHGLADDEVTPRFSEGLWAALQAAGVQGEYYTYPGADHLWQQTAQWQLMMERTVRFYDRHMRGE